MAFAILARHGPRGHLRAVQLAGVVSMLAGVTSSWAQGADGGLGLPFCPAYPPGAAPAIGPSNCTPIPASLWGPSTVAAVPIANGEEARLAALTRPPLVDTHAAPNSPALPIAVQPQESTMAPNPAAPSQSTAAVPQEAAVAPKAPAPPPVVALRTPGAVTLDQIAALLGPASKRAVTFSLSPADAYKKGDLTHRVSLTWSGPLQALVDQLGEVFGLDAAIDDSAIRFSSRQGERAGDPSTTRAP